MSLTSEIKNKSSPLSAFLGRELPELADLRATYRAARPTRAVVRPNPPDGRRIQYGTLGAALDHRLRAAFNNQTQPSGAIVAGIEILPRLPLGLPPGVAHATVTTGRELLKQLSRLIETVRPADRNRPLLLPDTTETAFARLYYAAAWFEEVYRTGRVWPGTPLGDAGADLTLSSLLASVPIYAIDDIKAQLTLANSALDEIRAQSTCDNSALGPTFAGSHDVGGADADMIIDGLLLEVKATVKPETLGRDEIYQLAGYMLLDYENEYSIGSAGFYSSRLGWLMTWDLEEYFILLGAKRSVPELRETCADLLSRR